MKTRVVFTARREGLEKVREILKTNGMACRISRPSRQEGILRVAEEDAERARAQPALAAVGVDLARQDVQKGGLAGAIGAQQADLLAGLDLEVDLVQQGEGAVVQGDVVEAEEGHEMHGIARDDWAAV